MPREKKKSIIEICNAQLTHNTNGYERTNYNAWRKSSRGMRIFKRFVAVACILLIAFVGIYGYWGYTHPLTYSVSNNQATLKGTSFFFDLMFPEDFNVDKYNEYPIVAIRDGALQNSKLKTVKLADSVKIIGNSAFAGNSDLTTVSSLSASITIGDNAFKDCINLNSIVFGGTSSEVAAIAMTYAPSGSINIGECAFENCVALESITLNGLTYLGANAFNGCTSLKEVYIDSGINLEIGMGAFNNVSSSIVVHIPTVEEDLYNSLVREYASVRFETYTRDRVEEVCYFIDKIGDISIDSLSAIEKAEQLYNALNVVEQGQVTNYGDLRDARAIYTTVSLISQIGPVTLQSDTAIRTAESSYNALNELQRARVANYSTLTDARAVFDTMKMIAEIGTVSVQSRSFIERAEAAYGALTDIQKGMVSNYAVLQEARNEYDVCVTIDLINSIGTITENSGSIIEQAELSYNNLSATLRARVTNYAVLQEARLIYNVILAIVPLNTITIDSMTAITSAEALYTALTAEQKSKVTNYALLSDARTIYSVVDLIDRIGTLTLNSETAISQAERAYEDLTSTQQKRVGNSTELIDIRAAYEVMVLIDAIGTVTQNSRLAITTAETSYNNLTAAQKRLVSNYATLETATYEFRVFEVIELIDAIGTVTLQSRSTIEAAETAYQSLTDEQRSRITNYERLKEARIVYEIMVVVNELGSVDLGNGTLYNYRSITSSNIVSVLNDTTVRNQVDSITLKNITSISAGTWLEAFPKLSMVRYDLSSGTNATSFTAPAGTLTYCLVGATSRNYSMKVSVAAGEEAHIAFDNFAFSSASTPLDTTNANHAYVVFLGVSSISATGNSGTAVKAKDLTIELRSGTNTTITAGDGISGNIGGKGIEVSNLTIISNGVSSLTVIGGNGSDGNNGSTGANGANSANSNQNGGNGYNGESGTAGTSGSAGGTAVSAYSIAVNANSATVTFTGGKGGVGGSGGTGGKGGTGMPLGTDSNTGNSKSGGTGGQGGNGGQGGAGGAAATVSSSFTVNSGTVVLNGGQGGTGSRNSWWFAGGGSGGAGGNGGAGGQSSSITVLKNGGTVTQSVGSKGIGGKGGTGGAGGTGGSGSGSNGSKGSAGSNGADGS